MYSLPREMHARGGCRRRKSSVGVGQRGTSHNEHLEGHCGEAHNFGSESPVNTCISHGGVDVGITSFCWHFSISEIFGQTTRSRT